MAAYDPTKDDPTIPEIDWSVYGKPDLTDEICALLGLDEKDLDHVKALDVYDSKYMLFHYSQPHCGAQKIRGVIVDISNRNPKDMKIVCTSFPYTPVVEIGSPLIKEIFDGVSIQFGDMQQKVRATNAYEGTILRMFYADNVEDEETHSNGVWLFATHKKVDGTRSRWGSGKPFYSIFNDVWDPAKYPYDILDKDKCYIFLISAPGNRIISVTPEPTVRLVAVHQRDGRGRMIELKFDEDPEFVTKSEGGDSRFTKNPNIIMPQVYDVTNAKDIEDLVSSMKWTDTTGILIRSPTKIIKVAAPGYSDLLGLRGTEPNIKISYLRVMQNERLGKVPQGSLHQFRHIYSEYESEFKFVHHHLSTLPQYLFDLYQTRQSLRDYSIIPNEEYRILENVRKEMMARKKARLSKSGEPETGLNRPHAKPDRLTTDIRTLILDDLLDIPYPKLYAVMKRKSDIENGKVRLDRQE